jgi:hypothetical protein
VLAYRVAMLADVPSRSAALTDELERCSRGGWSAVPAHSNADPHDNLGPARSQRADPHDNLGSARSQRADPHDNLGPARSQRADPHDKRGFRWLRPGAPAASLLLDRGRVFSGRWTSAARTRFSLRAVRS